MDYSDAGVDIGIEEKAATILFQAAKKSWLNRQGQLGQVLVPFDDFSGIRAIDVSQLPVGTMMNIGFDGIGTKVELAGLTNNYRTLAYDLTAMVCDDAVTRGGEPVLIGSILDVNSLGKDGTKLPIIRQLASGYVKAAKRANVAIINGELAQLGSLIGNDQSFSLSWGAAVVWFANRAKLITGFNVKPGDYIVGFEETSLRSNGISLVRHVMKTKLGQDWQTKKLGGSLLSQQAISASTIYAPAIVDMLNGWTRQKPKVKLSAVANITGGGLPSKLGRALKPSGYGADIYDPLSPTKLMLYTQQIGNVSDRQAYSSLHMGQGMVVVSPEPSRVIDIAKTHGIKARVIGLVRAEKGITIKSCGYYSKGQRLEFAKIDL